MLSDIQIQEIVNLICNQLDIVRHAFKIEDNLLDPDYKKGRDKHKITAIVYSAFRGSNFLINDIEIHKQFYGKRLCLPEFHVGKMVYQLYNSTAKPYDSQEIKEKIYELGEHFELLEFTVSDDYQLTSLEKISFNGFTNKGRARIKNRIKLYTIGQAD